LSPGKTCAALFRQSCPTTEFLWSIFWRVKQTCRCEEIQYQLQLRQNIDSSLFLLIKKIMNTTLKEFLENPPKYDALIILNRVKNKKGKDLKISKKNREVYDYKHEHVNFHDSEFYKLKNDYMLYDTNIQMFILNPSSTNVTHTHKDPNTPVIVNKRKRAHVIQLPPDIDSVEESEHTYKYQPSTSFVCKECPFININLNKITNKIQIYKDKENGMKLTDKEINKILNYLCHEKFNIIDIHEHYKNEITDSLTVHVSANPTGTGK
jgi:hypothetical protein